MTVSDHGRGWRAVLRGNWRSGERDGASFAYTAPSPGRYPFAALAILGSLPLLARLAARDHHG